MDQKVAVQKKEYNPLVPTIAFTETPVRAQVVIKIINYKSRGPYSLESIQHKECHHETEKAHSFR